MVEADPARVARENYSSGLLLTAVEEADDFASVLEKLPELRERVDYCPGCKKEFKNIYTRT